MNFSNIKKGLRKNTSIYVPLVFLFLISCIQSQKEDHTTIANPDFQWEYAKPESQGMSSQKLDHMRGVLAEKGTKKLLIIKNDKIVYEWFASGWEDSVKTHYTASLAKAVVSGMSLLGAMSDGCIELNEAACYYIPPWKKDGLKSKITIRQLATHTSGLADAKATEHDLRMMKSKGLHHHFDLPGWKGQFWRQDPDPFTVSRDCTSVMSTPGEKYNYSNPGIAMLTYAVTASLKESPYDHIRDYLKERIYGPIGISSKEYHIGYGKTSVTDGLRLVPSWGGGEFTAKAIARIGLLMLHQGNWQGKQIVDSLSVEKVTRYKGTALPPEQFSNEDQNGDTRSKNNPVPASTAGWYSNFDGVWSYVPRDAFVGAGAENQLLMVIPGLKMVIVRMGGKLFSDDESFWSGFEQYLFNPVMDAIEEPPYPKSNLSVEFAPPDSVIRLAKGSDNWPATWGNDGDLYTAYGDGNGFTPYTDIKLSLGLAKVCGMPPKIAGVNMRTCSGERIGQGKHGAKASGMLMTDGVLYMLVRNAQNAELMWSADHGRSWETADWKFDVAFGCPTFLNCGKNYENSPDDYLYIYSHDEADAYKNSDRFILTRVHRNHIKDWKTYEFFTGYDARKHPKWSEDIRKRGPVFTNPGKCYRSGITYNPGLKKYLWCQTIPSSISEVFNGVRFKGGLGIFESSFPWGPWKTVFYTRDWDIGPGETSSIPTKWMSKDGKTCYLLFSGDDCFSLRKLNFIEN